jgi:hypothetical protein
MDISMKHSLQLCCEVSGWIIVSGNYYFRFAVPMTGLCALQKFRYKSKNGKPKQEDQAYIIPNYSEKIKPEVVVTAYDNPAADFTTQL